nr:RcnB family protein [Acinetobacter pittii]
MYKPSKNQQWIKVNGDYVLVNVINHSVIKIIKG